RRWRGRGGLEPRRRRSRRSSNPRNRKIFVRRKRSRPPRNRAPPADRHSRRRGRLSRTATCPREQFSRTTPESSTPVPKEIGRCAEAAAGPVAEENLQRGRLDRQQAAEKTKPQE